MANGTIDSLNIEISASSDIAIKKINSIATALGKLKGISTLSKLADNLMDFHAAVELITEIPGAPARIDQITTSLSRLKGVSISSKLANNMKAFADAVSEITDDTVSRIDRLTRALSRLQGVNLRGFSSAVRAARGKTDTQGGTLQTIRSTWNPRPQNALATIANATQAELRAKLDRDLASGRFGVSGTGRASIGDSLKGLSVFGALGSPLGNIKGAVSSIIPALKNALTLVWNIGKSIAKWAFHKAVSAVKTVFGWMKKIAGAAADIAKKIPGAFARLINLDKVRDAMKSLSKVLSGLGRIAFYRAIRSAIKAVTEAFKEGSERAYFYAKEYGKATKYIADALDGLSSGSFKMSNQLGAAWATMLAVIQPILLQLISLVTRAAEVVTQFFAILGGSGTYLKAKDYTKAWADETSKGADAAKEWKNQLMGFDEINRLDEPSSGSGGGGGSDLTDYGNMFEEAKISSKFFDQLKEAFERGKWTKLGKMLGEKFNEIVNSIDFAGFGKKIGKGVQAAVVTSYNFLKTADFRNLGSKLAEMIDSLGDEVNFHELGRLSVRISTAIWDVLYGAFTNPGSMGKLAWNLSNFVIGALNELAAWIESLDPQKIATALSDYFGSIKYNDIKEAFLRVVRGAWRLVIDTKDLFLQTETGQKLTEKLKKVFGDQNGSITWSSVAQAIRERLNKAWNTVSEKFEEIWPKTERDAFMGKVIQKFDEMITEWLPKLHNVLMYELDKTVFGENWAAYHWSKGDYAGKEIIMGMIHGEDYESLELKKSTNSFIGEPVNQVLSDIEQSAKESGGNVTREMKEMAENSGSAIDGFNTSVETSASNIKTSMNQVASETGDAGGAFKAMSGNGINAIGNLDSGVYSHGQNIVNNLGAIRNAAIEAWNWIKNTFSLATNGSYEYNLPNGNKYKYNPNKGGVFANGGFPEDGIFYANHNELVGQFSNGKTAVANNKQIVEGIREGVFDGMFAAMSQNSNNGVEQEVVVKVYLDGREIRSSQSRYARAMGE